MDNQKFDKNEEQIVKITSQNTKRAFIFILHDDPRK
jgi:hypothetical protein